VTGPGADATDLPRVGEAGAVSDLDHLLDLQANDTTAAQLHHRRDTLPERARLIELAQRRVAVESEIIEPRAQRDELAREQKRLEDEVALVAEKVTGVDRQLYGGGVTSPKEAQALQADLESLKRRQSQLEDQVLEHMEQIEPLDLGLADAEATLASIVTETAEVEAALVAGEAAADAELETVAGARADLVAQVPAELIAEYDRLRPSNDGVAVARLIGPTCQGCHLTLAAAEVDEIRRRPADAIVHCPDCGRLLVR
jgi:predicted  nucleic acid-binding Zn-ribbon protein